MMIYIVNIYIGANILYFNKFYANLNHTARMSPILVEAGHAPPDTLPAQGSFTLVKIGSYVDDIENLSIRESFWTANFYLWFSWIGPKELDPGNTFIIVNGTITKRDLLNEYHGDDNLHYQRYRISAKLLKLFDTMRVPLEDHMLNIHIEDGARDGHKLRYVADPDANLSSRTQIPGYKIVKHGTTVKLHTYKTSHGDPGKAADYKTTRTQYIVGIEIQRNGLGVYLKIFVALFAAMMLALLNFFVSPSDVSPRFSLPSAAFFGAVSNSYVANSLLPPSGTFGLVDFISVFGMGTIFLTIALSLISNHIYVKKGDKSLAFILDRTMFFVMAFCCLMFNIILPMSALG
ncbi:MAG: hypothetical protein H7834_07025 [Magnetococcus sp. YQC-9]